jgi:hypothetical protein
MSKILTSTILFLTLLTPAVVLATDTPIFKRYNLPREACTREYGPVAALIYQDRLFGATLDEALLLNKEAPPVVIDLIKWVFALSSSLTIDQVRRMGVARCLSGSTI